MSGWSAADYLLVFVGLCLVALVLCLIVYFIAEHGPRRSRPPVAPPLESMAAAQTQASTAAAAPARQLDPAQVLRGAHRLADDIAAATLAAAGHEPTAMRQVHAEDAVLLPYAIGTSVFFARATGSYPEGQIDRLFAMTPADRTESLAIAEALHASLAAQGQGQDNAFLDFATMHLLRIFPEAGGFIAAGEAERFSRMVQAFGQATLGEAAGSPHAPAPE